MEAAAVAADEQAGEALNAEDGGSEVVRGGVDEGLQLSAALLDLLGALENALLEGAGHFLQTAAVGGDAGDHVVEGGGELSDFAAGAVGELYAEVAAGDLPGGLGEGAQRAGESRSEADGQDDGDRGGPKASPEGRFRARPEPADGHPSGGRSDQGAEAGGGRRARGKAGKRS